MLGMRCYLVAVLAAAVTPLTASAHFGLFFRPQETRAYYYCPAPVVGVTVRPVIAVPVAPAPIVTVPVVPVTPVTPVAPVTPVLPVPSPVEVPVAPPQVAVPMPAPPSGAPVVPAPPAITAPPAPAPPSPMPPAGPASTTSEKMRESFYNVYPSTERSALAGRTAVAVWNLSANTLTLTVAGQRRLLPAGQSLTLDLEREFSWQVEGRDAEVTRVPAGETGATLVIRR
jgi:hypothetical protein